MYAEWSARGAQFLTPPKQHQYEIRCYIRDPDGHLIEVGQTTDPEGDWWPAHWPSSAPAGRLGEGRDHGRSPRRVPVMTTAIIGTGGIGRSSPARSPRGEAVRLSSADTSRHQRSPQGSAGPRLPPPTTPTRCGAPGRRPRAAVCRAEGRHRRDRRPADRQARGRSSNPVGIDAHGNVSRLLPEGQSSGEVVAGWLPAGARLAMAFGTLSADLFESASHRSPEPAVLFYATDDDRLPRKSSG